MTSISPGSKLEFTLLSVKREVFDINLTNAANLCRKKPFCFSSRVNPDHIVPVVYGSFLTNAIQRKRVNTSVSMCGLLQTLARGFHLDLLKHNYDRSFWLFLKSKCFLTPDGNCTHVEIQARNSSEKSSAVGSPAVNRTYVTLILLCNIPAASPVIQHYVWLPNFLGVDNDELYSTIITRVPSKERICPRLTRKGYYLWCYFEFGSTSIGQAEKYT